MEYNYVLVHHGIKGQKWGIRRFQKKDGSLTAAGKKRYDDGGDDATPANKDYAKVRDNKKVKYMSDAELRERLNRLQMEAQYSQLSEKQVQQGKKTAKQILSNIGNKTLSGLKMSGTSFIESALRSIGKEAGKKVGEKIGNQIGNIAIEEGANIISALTKNAGKK